MSLRAKLAKLLLNNSDTEKFPQAQIEYLSKTGDCVLAIPYGVNARAISGDTLCLIIDAMGYEESRIAFPLSTTNRLKGFKDGESALVNEKTGAFIKHTEDGNLEISIPEDVIKVCKNITISADGDYNLNVTGNATIVVKGTAKIESTNAIVKANRVDLGDVGGKKVARIGDAVAGGVITGGSDTVFAVD